MHRSRPNCEQVKEIIREWIKIEVVGMEKRIWILKYLVGTIGLGE